MYPIQHESSGQTIGLFLLIRSTSAPLVPYYGPPPVAIYKDTWWDIEMPTFLDLVVLYCILYVPMRTLCTCAFRAPVEKAQKKKTGYSSANDLPMRRADGRSSDL
jgi:hypothetical protein